MTLRKALDFVIKAYVLFIIFEWFFFRWVLPVPVAISTIRLLGDLLPIILLLIATLTNQVKLGSFSLILLGFYLLSLLILLLSTIIHNAELAYLPGHFGVTFRFIPLAILVANLSNSVWNFDIVRKYSNRLLFFFSY
jgi:tellurite resistance protein TehA-like permease